MTTIVSVFFIFHSIEKNTYPQYESACSSIIARLRQGKNHHPAHLKSCGECKVNTTLAGGVLNFMAGRTGFEPVIFSVTGRRDNQASLTTQKARIGHPRATLFHRGHNLCKHGGIFYGDRREHFTIKYNPLFLKRENQR